MTSLTGTAVSFFLCPTMSGRASEVEEKREAIDEFGTIWKVSGATSLGMAQKGPLEDAWHLLYDYSLPAMKNWERFQRAEGWTRRLGGDQYRLGVDGNRRWERSRFLRGFEKAMTDLALNPEEVHRLMGMLTDMTIDIVDNFKKAGWWPGPISKRG
jgi:hypothetical protein